MEGPSLEEYDHDYHKHSPTDWAEQDNQKLS